MAILFALMAASIAILQMFGEFTEIKHLELSLVWGVFLLASCITSMRTSVVNIAAPDFSSFKKDNNEESEG